MIKKLQLRFSLLVLLALLVITCGTVAAINVSNTGNLERQADAILTQLLEHDGRRPALHEKPDELPPKLEMGQPEREFNGADLANSYALHLDEEGELLWWESDRAELYTEEQVRELAALAVARNEERGHIGSQYYQMKKTPNGTVMAVLDQRLEHGAAQRLLLSSVLVGLGTYLVLGIGAVLLIRRLTRPVQEAFDKQRQFVLDASHELKAPLAVISANAEVLAGEVGENQWLGYIRSELQRTDLLVKNLLSLARMDGDDAQALQQQFDLSKALLSVVLPYESAAFEAGKRLNVDITPGVLLVGDEEMLKQLTVILLDNALKYAAGDGTITVSLLTRGEKRILRVHNTGEGIRAEDLPHIFDRFYRADPSRNRESEGNGLGLAIAKRIVTLHRGKITAESDFGRSAAFTVTL